MVIIITYNSIIYMSRRVPESMTHVSNYLSNTSPAKKMNASNSLSNSFRILKVQIC